MKRLTYLGILLLCGLLPFSLQAQDAEKIRSLRIAIYTDVLKLTPSEAKLFWPVFEEYQKKTNELKYAEKRNRDEAARNYSMLTDAEAQTVLNKMIGFEQKQLDLKKEYLEEFKKVLPIKKVLLLQKAELQFKKALLEKIKNTETE
jgi:hypothetical protein